MSAQWFAAISVLVNVIVLTAGLIFLSRRRGLTAEDISRGFGAICMLVGMSFLAAAYLANLMIPGLDPIVGARALMVAAALQMVCISAAVFSPRVGRWWARKLASRPQDYVESSDGDAVRTEAESLHPSTSSDVAVTENERDFPRPPMTGTS
jgi:hypothetical protein